MRDKEVLRKTWEYNDNVRLTVLVTIDWDDIARIARKARRNKRQQSVAGPVTVTIETSESIQL